jgi:hypothetical protein
MAGFWLFFSAGAPTVARRLLRALLPVLRYAGPHRPVEQVGEINPRRPPSGARRKLVARRAAPGVPRHRAFRRGRGGAPWDVEAAPRSCPAPTTTGRDHRPSSGARAASPGRPPVCPFQWSPVPFSCVIGVGRRIFCVIQHMPIPQWHTAEGGFGGGCGRCSRMERDVFVDAKRDPMAVHAPSGIRFPVSPMRVGVVGPTRPKTD